MLLRFVAVAGAAVDLRQWRGVRQFLAVQIGVAGGALQRAVNGSGELFLVHEKSDTVRPPRLVVSDLSLWQARQSSLVGPGAAQHGASSNTKTSRSSAENERPSMRRARQNGPNLPLESRSLM